MELESRDVTLLSASTIGSPAAFSTAVKPPYPFSSQPSHDSSMLTQDMLAQLPHDHSQISTHFAGRLSLDSIASVHEKQEPTSEGSTPEGSLSQDDTSMGVLDLEALQDSSMTKFLTSPRTSQEFHLHITSSQSALSIPTLGTASMEPTVASMLQGSTQAKGSGVSMLQGSTQAKGSGVSMLQGSTQAKGSGVSMLQGSIQAKGSVQLYSARRDDNAGRSIPVEPPHSQVEGYEEEEGSSEGGEGVPVELLERASRTSSSVGYSHSEEEEGEFALQEGEDQLLPAPTPNFGGRWGHSPSDVLITRLRGDGHENETVSNPIPMQNGTKPTQPLVQHCHTADVSTSGSKHREGMHNHLPEKSPQKDDLLTAQFNVDAILQGLEGEGGMIPRMGDMVFEDEEPVDMTLIGDEVEPTLMREADEFSQFEPTHLASLLDRDSLLMGMRPPVTTGQESNPRQLSPPTATAAQVPPSMVATFPASVDRNDVLHGDLKVSEQVRPVAEGFTECDEHHDEILAESSRESHAGRAARVQSIPSEEYFSVGQGSELSIGDPLVSRQEIGVSLASGGGPAKGSSRHCVTGEEERKEEEEEEGDVSYSSGDSDRYESAQSEGASMSEVVDATTTMEGLPSAFLAPTSLCDMDDIGVPGTSLSSHSSLASSLTELAGGLGSTLGGPGEGVVPAALTETGQTSSVPEPNTSTKISGGVYNPFDSDDNASVGSFGQFEFGEQSSGSFIAQLAKDEEAVQKANLFTNTLTPSSQTLSLISQDLVTTSGVLFNNTEGEEVSIGSYFVKRSHGLGALPSTRLPPSDRPRFSDSDSHIIQSPPEQLGSIPPSSIASGHPLQAQNTSTDADQTLTEEPEEGTADSKPAQEKALTKSQPGSRVADLTPVITVHTPFPVQFEIPKLNLGDITVPTPGSFNPPRVSTTIKESEQEALHAHKPALRPSSSLQPQPNRRTVPISSTQTTSSLVTTAAIAKSKAPPISTASPDLEPDPSPVGMESRLSTGLEPGRTSQPTVGDASTLVFPELSALMFSPPPADLGSLDSIPTPSIARLSAGFNITEAVFQDGSFSTSVGVTKETVSRKVLQSPSKVGSGERPQESGTEEGSSPGTQAVQTSQQQQQQQQQQQGVSLTTQVQERQPVTKLNAFQSHLPTNSQSTAESPRKEVYSPKTEAARQRLAQLQATLEATRFDAESFLAKMKRANVPNSPLRQASREHKEGGSSPAVSKSWEHSTHSTNSYQVVGSSQELGAGDSPHTLPVTLASSLPPFLSSKEESRRLTQSRTSESPSAPHQTVVSQQRSNSVGTQMLRNGQLERSSFAEKCQLTLQDTSKESHHESPLPPKTAQVSSQPTITDTRSPSHRVPIPEQQTQEERSLPHQATAYKDAPNTSTITTVASFSRHIHTSSLTSPEMPTKHTPLQKSLQQPGNIHSHEVYKTTMSSDVPTSLSDSILGGHFMTKMPLIPQNSSDPVLVASGRGSGSKGDSHVTEPCTRLETSSTSTRTETQVTTVQPATSKILLSSKHTLPSEPPPASTSPPLHIPSSPLHTGTTPFGRPIYTSPPSHTTHSPSPPSHTAHLTTHSPSPPSHTVQHPSGNRVGGRTRAPNTGSLQVPDSLCFSSVCCVGSFLSDQLLLTNSGDRWLQLSFEVSQLYTDGAEYTSEEQVTFSMPQRCFVSPHKTETVKVTFTPHTAGSYEAVLQVWAQLVVGGEGDGRKASSLTSRVILKALAEEPKLEVSAGSRGSPVLDYGVLVGGTSTSLPLQLTNHGSAELPLKLSVSATTLSQICFSFGEVPKSLLPSSPPSHLSSPHHTLNITLPPKPLNQSKSAPHTIDIHFRAPKKYLDDFKALGPPDDVSACVDIAVDGVSAVGVLYSVPVRALVGVARLHVPRSLQALSLSCIAGQLVSRELPFKNAGNIPLRVRLRVSPDSTHFTITPDFLLMEPNEEVQVNVCFSSPSAPLTSEGSLMIHVEPSGPNYEMKLRGTATEAERTRDGLLSCSKRSLYWGGVRTNTSGLQKLVLHNSFEHKVPLKLSIRHHDSPFQLQNVVGATQSGPTQEIDLLPQDQLPLHIAYTPVSESIHCSALDIHDASCSKKYRIPLCGFGGASLVEVLNTRKSTNGHWIDMGEVVADQRSVRKVSLYNSGQRAAFVKLLCYPVDNDSMPLPLDQASITPSELILQPQHMKELLLVYHASEVDEGHCLGFPSPLARLVLLTGEEILRQRLQRSFGGDRTRQLTNPFNKAFLKYFPEQEGVPAELDFSSFEVEDEEKFFEQQLRRVVVSVAGSPRTESPLPPPLHPPPHSPPHLAHTLSPSHTPSTGDLTHGSSLVLSSRTLTLPDTPVGHYSEKFLEIHNPFSQPLRWHLSSVASPFVREIAGGLSDICKATYSAFWVHERRGTILPHSTAKVLVTFQPQDHGSFSQIWDLQVSTDESGPQKLRISFGGKAAATPLHRCTAEYTHTQPELVLQSLSSGPQASAMSRVHPTSSTFHSTGSLPVPGGLVPSTSRVSPPRKSVFIRDETIQFPLTTAGSKSTVKARICNRDTLRHKFEVIKPALPFIVDHHHFELGIRQCARLPVHFMPATFGEYEGILAVKTAAGHQAFALLKGSSCP